MGKLIDLTGKIFGKLTILERDLSKNNGTYWKCQCECGNVISARKDQLTRQKYPKRSCGCDQKEKASQTHLKNEIGNKYGYLTVLYRTNDLRPGEARWHCKCKCGNECDVSGIHLRNGSVQSCGCKKFETKNSIDETGNRYGKLIVIKREGEKNSHLTWLCQCDCGNLCVVKGNNLRNGTTTSCGCYAKEKSSEVHLINEVGNKYGKLTVLGRDETKKDRVYWICQCECGNFTSVAAVNLRNGNVKSCGCLKSWGEQQILNILQTNNISYKKEYIFPNLKNTNNTGSLRFDFAIFNQDGSLSHLIEYDGEQHFKPNKYFGGQEGFLQLQENDNRKNIFCKENNIKLIRIKYNDIITLKKIIDKDGDNL